MKTVILASLLAFGHFAFGFEEGPLDPVVTASSSRYNNYFHCQANGKGEAQAAAVAQCREKGLLKAHMIEGACQQNVFVGDFFCQEEMTPDHILVQESGAYNSLIYCERKGPDFAGMSANQKCQEKGKLFADPIYGFCSLGQRSIYTAEFACR